MKTPEGKDIEFQEVLELFKDYIKTNFRDDPTAKARFRDQLLKRFGLRGKNWGDLYRKIYNKSNESEAYVKNRMQTFKILYEEFQIPFNEWIHDPELFSEDEDSIFITLEMDKKWSKEEKKKKFIELYLPKVRGVIEKARSSIHVYDYTGRGRSSMKAEKAIPYYSEAHKEIYELFESLIEEYLLEYKRFLVLPRPEIWPEKVKETDAFMETILKCSEATYAHVVRCLIKKTEPQTAFAKCSFYVVYKPTSVHHFGVIDSKWAVSEYYRYDADGDFIPDLLFIDQVNKKATYTKLIAAYQGNLNKLETNSRRCYELNLYGLRLGTKKAYEKTVDKLTQLQHAVQVLQDNDEPVEKVNEANNRLNYWQDERSTMERKIEFFNSVSPRKLS